MRYPDIFQVEDSDDFIFLMEHAVTEISRDLRLVISINGNEAIKALAGLQARSSKPGLILLDINLPGISGVEVLKKIRENDFFQSVPIVMLERN